MDLVFADPGEAVRTTVRLVDGPDRGSGVRVSATSSSSRRIWPGRGPAAPAPRRPGRATALGSPAVHEAWPPGPARCPEGPAGPCSSAREGSGRRVIRYQCRGDQRMQPIDLIEPVRDQFQVGSSQVAASGRTAARRRCRPWAPPRSAHPAARRRPCPRPRPGPAGPGPRAARRRHRPARPGPGAHSSPRPPSDPRHTRRSRGTIPGGSGFSGRPPTGTRSAPDRTRSSSALRASHRWRCRSRRKRRLGRGCGCRRTPASTWIGREIRRAGRCGARRGSAVRCGPHGEAEQSADRRPPRPVESAPTRVHLYSTPSRPWVSYRARAMVSPGQQPVRGDPRHVPAQAGREPDGGDRPGT